VPRGWGGLVGGEFALHSSGRGGAAEGSGDGGDVVVDHADVGALVGAFFTHGVGEEGAADGDFVALGVGAGDEGVDVSFGDGGFDEDGFDVVFYDEVDEVFDVADACFGFCGDALDADDLVVVSSSEVAKGVVGGDEDALGFGDC